MLIMAKLDKFLGDLVDDEFPEAIQKVNTYVYELLENQQSKSGGGKVTREILNTVKKCMDYINLRLVKAHKEYVSSEAKLKTMVTDSKAYEALLMRRSGTSDSIIDQCLVDKVARRKPVKMDKGYSVLITPNEGTAEDLRDELRKFSRTDQEFPKLSDVVSTKTGQLVLKVKSKQDSDKLVEKMQPLRTKVKISAPQRRRSRILLLSLDKDIQEKMVIDSLREVIVDEGLEQRREIDIVRKIDTRMGKVNWVLDVDNEVFRCLTERKRICIDFSRYRVVEFLQITRCFKCQGYGHISSRCQGVQRCQKCAGEHRITECTTDTEKCVNCADNEDGDIDSAHRADSSDCPAFRAYREELLAKRL